MTKKDKKTRNMFRLSKAANALSTSTALRYKLSRPDMIALAIDIVEKGDIDVRNIPSIEDASNGQLKILAVACLDKQHHQKLKNLAFTFKMSKSEVIRRLIGLMYNFG